MAHINLARILVDAALERGRGEAHAVREPKRVWSYAKLHEEAGRAAAALEAHGIKAGDRVALLMHESAELAALFVGALRLGAVPAPLSTLLRPLEVRALLADAGARAIVLSEDLAEAVDPVRHELPALEHILAVGGARAGHVDLNAVMRQVEPRAETHEPDEATPAYLLYSSGPGGAAKGVAHGHQAARYAHFAYAESVLALDEGDRVFCTASLSSAYGLGLGLLFPFQAGATTFLLPARPRPRTVFEVMTSYKPTVFAATPSLYGMMVHDYKLLSEPRPRPFESVRVAVSGGEGMPAPLERRVHATFKTEVLHGFGTTEALHFVLSNRAGARREGSAGRPLPGIEARVVDDAGRPVASPEIGALEVKGPQVARGYFGRAAHPAFHDGWVRLGDRFFVDDDGFYYHCGRADDLFKVSGRWVAPEEVEQTLLAHPAVWECAVVEGHDEDGLARPVAFVVPNVGRPPTEELAVQLMEFVKREIAPYKYPREIVFVDGLPKDAGGRVQRWRLRRGGTATT